MALAGAFDVDDGRNGGLTTSDPFVLGGNRGGGEKASGDCSVSTRNMWESDSAASHGGGTMLARFCRLSRRASQRGMFSLRGG
jgi:hypothetical protein